MPIMLMKLFRKRLLRLKQESVSVHAGCELPESGRCLIYRGFNDDADSLIDLSERLS